MAQKKFSVQLMCLRLINFPKFEEKSLKYYFIRVLQTLTVLSGLFWKTHFVFENYQNIIASAECAAPLTTQIIVFAKLVTIMAVKEKLYSLIDRIKDLENDLNEDELRILEKVSIFEKRVLSICLMSAVLSATLFCVAPITADMIKFYVLGGEYSYAMPSKSAFFYDITKSPAYEITYVAYCFAAYITVNTSVSSNDSAFQNLSHFTPIDLSRRLVLRILHLHLFSFRNSPRTFWRRH